MNQIYDEIDKGSKPAQDFVIDLTQAGLSVNETAGALAKGGQAWADYSAKVRDEYVNKTLLGATDKSVVFKRTLDSLTQTRCRRRCSPSRSPVVGWPRPTSSWRRSCSRSGRPRTCRGCRRRSTP